MTYRENQYTEMMLFDVLPRDLLTRHEVEKAKIEKQVEKYFSNFENAKKFHDFIGIEEKLFLEPETEIKVFTQNIDAFIQNKSLNSFSNYKYPFKDYFYISVFENMKRYYSLYPELKVTIDKKSIIMRIKLIKEDKEP